MQVASKHFWALVEQIGWGTKTTDYKAVGQSLKAVYTPEEIHGFEAGVRGRIGKLSKAVTQWEQSKNKTLPCGDDGYSDLCHHIVGLGREVFQASVKDPSLVYKRAQAYDYKESFSYCFLASDGSGERIGERIKKSREFLSQYDSPEYAPVLTRMNEVLDKVEADWKLGDSLKAEMDKLLAEAYTVLRDKIDLEKYRSDYHQGDMSNPLHNKWALLNIFSDATECVMGNALGLTRIEGFGQDPMATITVPVLPIDPEAERAVDGMVARVLGEAPTRPLTRRA